MKRLIFILMSLLLLVGRTSAVDETSWGEIKQAREHPDPTSAATKPAPTKTNKLIMTELIGQGGGTIKCETQGGPQNGASAIFEVPNKALDAPVEITMELVVRDDGAVTVKFAPGGLVFQLPASLTVRVAESAYPAGITSFEVQHIYADGTVESVPVVITQTTNFYLFELAVPGFSRYSMGGGA